MQALSNDLRKRILDAVDNREGSRRQLVARFCVNTSTITRVLQLRRKTGSFDPRPHGGGVAPTLDHDVRGGKPEHDSALVCIDERSLKAECLSFTVLKGGVSPHAAILAALEAHENKRGRTLTNDSPLFSEQLRMPIDSPVDQTDAQCPFGWWTPMIRGVVVVMDRP